MENKTVSFKQLVVWQKSHEFVLLIYELTKKFPKEELFGLTSQFRRAAVSIAANIAEGYIKKTKPDKYKFFNISQGSLEECRYFILLAKDLQYISDESFEKLENSSQEISKLLNSYIKRMFDETKK